jgi:N-acetylmuramoyl-L-alanine amidase
MKVRIKNKRVFSLWCIVLVAIFLNLIYAVNKRLNTDKMANNDLVISTSHIALAADKNGSIAYTENKYFKRYIIDCSISMKDIKWDENKDFIEIYFDKKDISNLNIKESNSKNDSVYYEYKEDKLHIKVKKVFNKNNSVYVDSVDNKKVVVLVAKQENPFHNTVVLDAGHGGVDKGANRNGIYEKDITLKISKLTAEELMYNGFKVVKSRDEDKLLSLREVGDIVNEASADVFISIHINDNKVSQYKSVSTYYYDPNGYQKEDRIRLANTMQKELVMSDNWQDRGIVRENLAVLRYSEIPCVLLELGFLSNPEDRDKLTNDEILKKFAINITKGISRYLSVE